MVDDKDDRFRPKLGKPRARGGKQAKRFIDRVLHIAGRAGPGWSPGPKRHSRFVSGERIGRGAATGRLGSRARDPLMAFRTRRVVIKARIVKLAGTGFAKTRAHIRYVERDGTGRDGEPGRLYDASGEGTDGKAFMERCEGDRHQFRFMVSPEDTVELEDLKPFVRDLMAKMEEDLGTRLDWVAVDHFNTDNPHSHVLLRGKNDRDENLVIARDYIGRGMRRRAAELLTLELGPRTDRDIEQAMRREVEQDRFTGLDRRLLRTVENGVIDLRHEPEQQYQRFNRNLLLGRLEKLRRMGLAEEERANVWRLSGSLEGTLRRAGERGDIIKTMHAEMKRQGIEHAEADYAIYDPAANRLLTGRVVSKGLSDEMHDRTYLIVDGLDGRTHYVDVGQDSEAGEYGIGAIVEIVPRLAGPKPADRVVAEVARAKGGIYSPEAHQRYDERTSARFVQAHVWRLEALRREGHVTRLPDGSWVIPEDYLEQVTNYERARAGRQPVSVSVQSSWSLDRQIAVEGATWLDRQLLSSGDLPVAATGFGQEASKALEQRRHHLIDHGYARERSGRTIFQRNLLRVLERRELKAAGSRIASETGLAFREAKSGDRIEGTYRQRVDLASGRFAMIEQSKEFSLVPWRAVLERARGKPVSGIVRGETTSWDIGRKRGPAI